MNASNIRLSFEQALSDKIINQDYSTIGRELSQLILKLIWDRTSKGIDIKGRLWRRYKAKGYAKKKQQYGRGKNDWLVLSGDLKRSLGCKYVNTTKSGSSVTLNFELTIPEDQKKKVEGLLSSTGHDRNGRSYPKSDWLFLGLSEVGTEKANEASAIVSVLKKKLKL